MINKNISIWRGTQTPPTNYHLWEKEDGGLYVYLDEKWQHLVTPADKIILDKHLQQLDKIKNLALTEIDPIDTNTYKSYLLKSNDNVFGTTIDIPKDKFIKLVTLGYDNATIDTSTGNINIGTGLAKEYLLFSITLDTGNYELISINLSEFITEKDYSDGLEIVDNKLKVKVDPNSEEYLKVTNNGIKVEGINTNFNKISERLTTISNTQIKRSEMGVVNGVATLDNNSTIPYNLLPAITDDEDLIEVNNRLKLKDRIYDPGNFSGKGYVILRKNIINGKNVLTQDMINEPNTVYEIRYDFDLNDEDIHIPSDCVLKFVGGQFRNGSIVGDNTRISATNKSIFYNVIVKSGCIGELQYEMYANTENSYLGEFKVLRQYITDCYNNNLQPYFGLRNKLIVEYDGIPIEVPEGKVLDFNDITIECINTRADNSFIKIRTSPFIAITDDTIINNLRTGLELNQELNNVDFIEKNKTYLINIKDNNPWTDRESYGISFFRKDITLIHNRLVYNLPIATYNNEYSSPSYSYREVLNSKTIIRNLTFIRSESSTKITQFLIGEGVNNLEISNINVNTVNKNNLSGDAVILIDNSANVTIKNCVLYGLYDYEGYAYGFALTNIYNFVFQNCRTYNNNWGVFGNNNLNKVTVNDCTINRFDIHCYGKDLVFNRCSFMFKYNQYSSIYGKIIYNNCCFTSFIPCLIEPSYNCYTPFDLILNNCVFNGIYPVYHEDCNNKINTRAELQDKCLPNIDMNNCCINDISSYSENSLGNFILMKSKPLEVKRNHINNITIDGLTKLVTKSLNLIITTSKIVTQEDLSIQLNNVILANSEEYSKLASKYFYENSFNFNNINPEKGNIVKIIVDNSNLCFDIFNCTQNIQISCINSNLFNFRDLPVNSDINKFFYKNCTIHLTNVDESSSNRNFFPKGAVFEDCLFNNSYNDNRVPSSNLHFIRCAKTISNKPLLINALVLDDEELNNFSAVNPNLNVDLSVRDLDPSASNLVDLGTMKTNGIKAVNKVNNRKLYYLDGGEVFTHFLNYGAFADRPTDAPAGFEYFCTDKQTAEGSIPGIVIYNRGDNIWVDALGRVIN